jgi:hypothetical protein
VVAGTLPEVAVVTLLPPVVADLLSDIPIQIKSVEITTNLPINITIKFVLITCLSFTRLINNRKKQ